MDEQAAGKGGQGMNTTYQTLIVKFSEPIKALDGIFDDAEAWGTDTLKGGLTTTRVRVSLLPTAIRQS